MDFKTFLGYALGTAFALAAVAVAVGVAVLIVSVVPLMLVLFPVTLTIVGAFMLVGYLRHRRGRRGSSQR